MGCSHVRHIEIVQSCVIWGFLGQYGTCRDLYFFYLFIFLLLDGCLCDGERAAASTG